MKQVVKEPGFWMMILFVILVAIIMYAPSGECDDKTVRPPKVIKKVIKKPRPVTINIKSDKEAAAVALLVKYFNSGGM